MKIAHIVCVYPPYAGGIGTAAKNIHEIVKRQHDSHVFTPKYKQTQASQDDKVNYISTPFKLGKVAILFSLLKKLKSFDTIYFHYPFFGTSFIIYIAKLIYPSKKLIIHYHMDVVHKNILFKILSWPDKMISKKIFQKSDLIVCASLDYIYNSNIKTIAKSMAHKIIEIPFYVDSEVFKTDLNLKKEKNKKQILFVGGLDKTHYFKGLELLIKAYAGLQVEDCELIICGDGDLKEYYQKLSQKYQAQDSIIFLGKLKLEELIKAYQKADILVLPSINKNEAFGIVLIEAMACMTVPIASNLAGVRTVFKNNESGLLFEVNNVEDLKDKLKSIIEDDNLREEMSRNAYKLFKERYDKQVIENKILEIFEKQ